VSRRFTVRLPDLLVFFTALVLLLALHAHMGLSLDEDSWTYMLWGRELATGESLNRATIVSPKVVPVLIAAACHVAPGENGPPWLYAALLTLMGAGIVWLTCRLASRMGGTLAGLVTVPLVLGHMQFIRYVTNGQSSVGAAFFVLAALVFATREEAGPRDYLWAAVMIFVAGLWRAEAAVLAAGLAVALYLRLGWKRPWWPAVVFASGVASGVATMVFCKVAFGDWQASRNAGLEWVMLLDPPQPGLGLGFVKKVVNTLFYYLNQSWLLVLFAAVGAGLLASWRHCRRYVPLAFLPLVTTGFTWLILAPGKLFSGQSYGFTERCFYYITFIAIALAGAAIARLASWASSDEQFLGGLPSRCRAAAFTAICLGFLAPVYLSRPLPERGVHNQALERAFAYLKDQLPESPQPRIVVPDDMSYLFYRLRLPADACSASAIRIIKAGDGKLPANVHWGVIDEESKPVDFPPEWGLRLVWEHPSGQVKIYRRGTP